RPPRGRRRRLLPHPRRALPSRDALLGLLLSLVRVPDDVSPPRARHPSWRGRSAVDVPRLLVARRPRPRRAPGRLGPAPAPAERRLRMATETKVPVLPAKGGSFLVEDRRPEEIFTPEDFTDEQKMIADTAAGYMGRDVMPRLGEILALKYETTRELLRKAGELGLLGIEIPEAYGGVGPGQGSGGRVAEG